MISNIEHIGYLLYGGPDPLFIDHALATNIYDFKNHAILNNKMCLIF